MVYTLSVFSSLREQFPQWSALREHLEGAEGGRLRIIESEGTTCIIRYDKATTDFSKPHVKWFRSVVWDTAANLPLCVAPPKADAGLPGADVGELRWEPFLEGVMVNAYKTAGATGAPLLASRSKLGATGTYYSPRSFEALLEDALAEAHTTVAELLGTPASGGETATFVSMLLQHPEHRIVAQTTRPSVHVVHRGRVLASGEVVMDEQVADHGIAALDAPVTPALPLTPETMGPWMTAETERRGWQWQGVVLKDGKGGRWRMRSTPYSMVRTMRGGTPRQDVRFLQLRQRGLVPTYLIYYPEERAAFRRLEQEVRNVTQHVYDAYVAVHIKKTQTFQEAAAHWRPHIYTLHGQYLGSLRAQGFFVRKKEVIEYVNALPIPRILHLLRKLRGDATATVTATSTEI